MSIRYVTLPDATQVSAVGQGTWYMGEGRNPRRDEVRALQLGLDLGMQVIDTAEMYGEGGAEEVVGEALRGRRDQAFLVSKVYPYNAGRRSAVAACERSLGRLGTDTLDLYLLHWRGGIKLAETLEAFEALQRDGKIRRYGVSNFSVDDMRELQALAFGEACTTDQVLYHLGSRGIEYDLLPWCREHGLPIMAYCPLAQGGRLRTQLLEHAEVTAIAAEYGISAAQVLLAWVIRAGDVIAIPKAVRTGHVRENAAGAGIVLSDETLSRLDAAFSPPDGKQPLDIV